MCLLVPGVLLPESGRSPLGAPDGCSSLSADLLVFLLCSCPAGYILTLVLHWSLEHFWAFYARVLPKAVSVYNVRLFPRTPLNPVHKMQAVLHQLMAPPMASLILARCLSFFGDCVATPDPHFQRQMGQYAFCTTSSSSDYFPAKVHEQNSEQFPHTLSLSTYSG